MSLVKADMANHRQHQPSLATNASIVPASAIPDSSNPTLQQQQQQQQAAVDLIIVEGERCRNSRRNNTYSHTACNPPLSHHAVRTLDSRLWHSFPAFASLVAQTSWSLLPLTT